MERRGYTIIETIAAIIILAIALPPMLMAIEQATQDRAQPILVSRARWLASEKLEDVIADRYSEERGYDYLKPGNYPRENSIATDPGFSRSVALQETGSDLSTPGDGYMIVTVAVTWTDEDGSDVTYEVSTVLTDFVLDPSRGRGGRAWKHGMGGGGY